MAQSGNIGEVVNIVGRLFIIEYWSKFAGQAAVNRVHYKVTAVAGGGLTFGQILAQYNTIFPVNFKPLLSNVAVFAGFGIRGVFGQPMGLAAPAYDNTATGAGTGGANPMPSQVSGLIKLGTFTVGRTGRGRFYVPFPSTSASGVGEVPNAGYLTALDALGGQLIIPQTLTVGGASVTIQAVLWNRLASVSKDVTFFASRPAWATQRRRGDYGRLNLSPV